MIAGIQRQKRCNDMLLFLVVLYALLVVAGQRCTEARSGVVKELGFT